MAHRFTHRDNLLWPIQFTVTVLRGERKPGVHVEWYHTDTRINNTQTNNQVNKQTRR